MRRPASTAAVSRSSRRPCAARRRRLARELRAPRASRAGLERASNGTWRAPSRDAGNHGAAREPPALARAGGLAAFLAEQSELALQRDARIELLLARLDAAHARGGVPLCRAQGRRPARARALSPGRAAHGGHGPAACARGRREVERVMQRSTTGVVRNAPPRGLRAGAASAPSASSASIRQPLKIEMHTECAEPLPVRRSTSRPGWLDGDAQPGMNAYPSIAELMRHLLLHAAGNMRAHALRQIQLHDIALLAPRNSAAARWLRVCSKRRSPAAAPGGCGAARAYRALRSRLPARSPS